MATFSDFNSQQVLHIVDGISGRTITGERMTLALVDIEPNAKLPEHRHENEQMGFIVQGELVFTIGGETRTLRAGDNYVITSDTPHDAAAGPAGCVVVDVFAPVRADWEKLERSGPSPSAWETAG